jgi:uncharacterized delta-60 repeat protein
MNLLSAGRAYLLCAAYVVLGGCSGGGGEAHIVSPRGPGAEPSSSDGFNQAGGFNGAVLSMLPASDGSGDIYVSGDFTAYSDQAVAHVVRLRPDGTLHEGFALAGSIIQTVNSMALADDDSGDLYVAEQVGGSPVNTGRLWKIHADGTVDSTFAVGTAAIDEQFQYRPFVGNVIRSLVSVGDQTGRVYAAVSGLYNGATVGSVVRVNADGSLDAAFGTQAEGVFRIVPAGDGSGDLYIASWLRHSPSGFTSNLSRLNADGTADAAFQVPGHWPHALYQHVSVSLIVPVGDGSGDLLAVGFFPDLDAPQPIASAVRGLVRINPDGTLDLTSPRPQVDPAEAVVALAKANDGSGDWFVGQTVTQAQSRVLRYKPDGTIDSTFTAGLIGGNDLFNREWALPPYLLMPAPDSSGDLYVGGEFFSYNGVRLNNMARVSREGTLN